MDQCAAGEGDGGGRWEVTAEICENWNQPEILSRGQNKIIYNGNKSTIYHNVLP